MDILNLLTYVIGFVLIWYGAGLIVSSTSKFSSRLRLSSFAFSFVFLGILTSIPEFSVGLQAVGHHTPQIFVGNLMGGIIVLFLVVIPILAVFGNGIKLNHQMEKKTLLATAGVILAPALTVLDKKVSNFEGLILIVLYLVLLFFVERKNGIFDRENSQLLNRNAYSYKDILKIISGIAIVFIASSLIVDNTLYFAKLFNISTFYIGLLVVALGTDLPEMTLAIRSVLSSKRDIAMGDYIGAAAASTLLFGILTLLNDGEVVTISNFLVTFGFMITALTLFVALSIKKNFISRKWGVVLFSIYILFIAAEVLS